MIVSNATIYPRESNKNNKKNQHMDDSHQVQSYECSAANPAAVVCNRETCNN